MDITCLRSLALNILKNGYPESIASSIEIPELEPCSICNEEIFLHLFKKSFTVLTCGHIFHRLCLENNRENTITCPGKNCVTEIEIIERSPLARMTSQRSMSIDRSQDKTYDLLVFNNAPLENDPSFLDTITEEDFNDNQTQNMESDIPGTLTASTLPSKRVGDLMSADKPSNKKLKAVNREDSSKLKKLVNELSSTENSPQVTGIIEENAPSENATIFLYLFRKIDCAESRNEVTNREVINSYFDFGEALKKRHTELKKNNSGSASSAILNRELRSQIPTTITKEALRKRTEKARKIYKLFDAPPMQEIYESATLFSTYSMGYFLNADVK
ncbi:6301_t:CDS:2 [Entrophospora sp. SA101]|nr:6301_t:CDS:2 [Entrophospora sp. SA101]